MKKTGIRFFLISIFLAVFGTAQAESPTEDLKAKAESIRRQAIDDFNAKNYDDAEKGFYQLISVDYQAPMATYAVEFLKRITIDAGHVDSALKEFDEKKKEGQIRDEPEWNPLRKATFDNLKLPGRLEEHLFSPFKLGGVVAARTSLIGVILDGMGLNAQAAYYFDQATQISDRAQNDAWTRLRDYLRLRPLQFEWPNLFTQAGMPVYSAAQIDLIPFRDVKTVYPDVQIRKGLAGWYTYFRGGIFPFYDSNAVKKSESGSLPPRVAKPQGMSQKYLINIGSQGNIAGLVTYGWDYHFTQHHYLRDDLGHFGTLAHLGSIWGSLWNKHDSELRGRYDIIFNDHHAEREDVYSRVHGPMVAWARVWNQRYRTDVSYSLKFNSDDHDPVTGPEIRSGTEHMIRGRVSYPGKTERVEPYFSYTWTRLLADGKFRKMIGHELVLGNIFRVWRRGTVNLGTFINWDLFPGTDDSITDRRLGLKLDSAFPVLDELLMLTFSGSYVGQTSGSSLRTYSRYTLVWGIVVTFGG